MHELIRLLTEFGADEALIALAQRFIDREQDGVEALTGEEITTLREGLVGLAEDDEASVALLTEAADLVTSLDEEVTAREEAAEAEEAAVEEQRRRLRGETAQDEEGDGDDESEGEGDGDGDGESEAPADPEAEDADASVPAPASARRTARRDLARHRPRSAEPVVDSDDPERARIVLAADLPGARAGTEVDSLREIDPHLVARWERFRHAKSAVPGREQIPVATVLAHYPPERQLGPNSDENTQRVTEALRAGLQPQARVASGGLCAPLTPYYGVEVLGDDRRPVRDALVGFQATRGGIISMAPPMLPALAGSSIVWTEANDTDPGSDGPATKPCLRIDCGDNRETSIHAVPFCLEIGNFMARTHGEWVDAWSELGLVGHARLAEQTLLDAIETASTAINNENTVISAVVDLLAVIDIMASTRRSFHRLSRDFPFRVILPETLLPVLRIDIARSLPGGSFQENLTLAEAAIGNWFSARNISVTWTPDSHVVGAQGVGAMADLPPTIEFPLYPEGAFLFLDQGRLDLGVVRDSTLNSTNDAQVFVETFEGVHLVGVESWWLSVDVCPSGGRVGTIDPAALCASYT